MIANAFKDMEKFQVMDFMLYKQFRLGFWTRNSAALGQLKEPRHVLQSPLLITCPIMTMF